MKKLAFLLTAALLFLGFAACTHTPQQALSTDWPTAEPTAQTTPDQTVQPTAQTTPAPTAEPRILYGSGEYAFPDISIGNGGVYIVRALQDQLEQDEGEYDGCVFAVEISLTHADHGLAERLAKEADELTKSEEFRRYEYAYMDWFDVNYRLRQPDGMTPQEVAEELGYDPQWFWSRGDDELENGYRILSDMFEAWWKTQIPEDEWRACVEAHHRQLEAHNAVWGEAPEVKAEIERSIAGECERLNALGLYVFINRQGRILGFLTKEQLLSFPSDEQYGYFIMWQSKVLFDIE